MKFNPYGYWKVTTEDDVEGKKLKFLGIFKGYIHDIALSLKKSCGYTLEFEKLNVCEEYESQGSDANIRVVGKTIYDIRKSLEEFGFHVSPGQYYQSIHITKKPVNIKKENARKAKKLLLAAGFNPDEIKEYL